MISVYITFRDEPEARSIARHLLEKRLIACANIFPVKSMFWWQGKVTDEQEVAMLAKAPKRNFGRIKDEVRKLHSYEVPCIVSLPVEHKDEDFSRWVEGETQS